MKIGFVSTRFSGTDGVTLEASKWAHLFESNGHTTYWFAGELDRNPAVSYRVPEAHFQHQANVAINTAVIGYDKRPAEITEQIHDLRAHLKKELYRFLRRFEIDLLIAENILSLPMQLPLGLALTEVIAEAHIPTIAHHHDFSWERERYALNAVEDLLPMAFPPKLPGIAHVVINSAAQQELARRTGLAAIVAPNVLDFATPPVIDWDAVNSFKAHTGLTPDDTVILQPTRIIQRKGIEHAINLVRFLDRPNCKLVISHEAGDEGYDYARWIDTYARSQGVPLITVDARIDDPWGTHTRRHPQFSLYDIYPCAHVVTFPSLNEGFGNALLEAIYFKKPILVNRYATYIRDIEPLGFQMAAIDGFLTEAAVRQVIEWIDDPEGSQATTAHNYQIAGRYFSYARLLQKLNLALQELFDDQYLQLENLDRRSKPSIIRPPIKGLEPTPSEIQWAKAYN